MRSVTATISNAGSVGGVAVRGGHFSSGPAVQAGDMTGRTRLGDGAVTGTQGDLLTRRETDDGDRGAVVFGADPDAALSDSQLLDLLLKDRKVRFAFGLPSVQDSCADRMLCDMACHLRTAN